MEGQTVKGPKLNFFWGGMAGGGEFDDDGGV